MLPISKRLKKNIYLDYASTTPVDPEVKKVMDPFFSLQFGNPSSLHKQGREAKVAIESARNKIANCINAKGSEIVFTAGGTESVNLAVLGVAKNSLKKDHLITSAIEHDCVLNSFKALETEGYKTSFVSVDKNGFVNLEELKKSVRPETVLISIMYANNEIGTVQPIAEIGKWLKIINTERLKKGLTRILFHTDACQATGYLDMNVQKLGVDLMSVNGSKIYGPKQTGFLYVKSGVNLKPNIYGGGQEKEIRSGTENVPGIVGLAKALELVQLTRESENQRIGKLRQYLIAELLKMPNVLLNGVESRELKVNTKESNNIRSLPNNINVIFEGLEGEALMLYLDSYGISVSTASACNATKNDPSHVLMAIGRTETQAKSGIRLSLGKYTKKSELEYLIKILPEIVFTLRGIKK